jgi:hypothetical protein
MNFSRYTLRTVRNALKRKGKWEASRGNCGRIRELDEAERESRWREFTGCLKEIARWIEVVGEIRFALHISVKLAQFNYLNAFIKLQFNNKKTLPLGKSTQTSQESSLQDFW